MEKISSNETPKTPKYDNEAILRGIELFDGAKVKGSDRWYDVLDLAERLDHFPPAEIDDVDGMVMCVLYEDEDKTKLVDIIFHSHIPEQDETEDPADKILASELAKIEHLEGSFYKIADYILRLVAQKSPITN